MSAETEFQDSVRRCWGLLSPLVPQADQYLKRIPEIACLVERSDRFGDWAGKPRSKKRAQPIFQKLMSERLRFYNDEFKDYTKRVLVVFDELQSVLLVSDVDKLKAQVQWPNIGTTCRAVLEAKRQLERYLEPPEIGQLAAIPSEIDQALVPAAAEAQLPIVANSSVQCGPRSVAAGVAAAKLKAYIKKNGLNYSQFSERTGKRVSAKTIGKFLRTGVATPSVLDEIAAGMGITKEKLLSGTE